MDIHMNRCLESGDFILRITDAVFERVAPQAVTDAMVATVKEFVRTDPEVRILINEMVKQAFGSVDLLQVVTETIKEEVRTLKPPPDKPILCP